MVFLQSPADETLESQSVQRLLARCLSRLFLLCGRLAGADRPPSSPAPTPRRQVPARSGFQGSIAVAPWRDCLNGDPRSGGRSPLRPALPIAATPRAGDRTGLRSPFRPWSAIVPPRSAPCAATLF